MSGQTRQSAASLDEVIHSELDEINTRREVAELDDVAQRDDSTGADRAANSQLVGLALSGGGVRSAAYSLGVLQGLQRSGVLQRVDYLSTVSGGAYAGAYLSSSVLSAGIPDPKGHEEASAATLANCSTDHCRSKNSTSPHRRSREERHLNKALGDSCVQLPRIRQLLSSGGFLWDKVHWLNRQVIGMLLVWSVVLSGLAAFAALAAYLFRKLDYIAVRELLNGIGVRDDLTLAMFPPMVLLCLYLICWTLSYFKYARLARGNMARRILMLFVTTGVVAVTALLGNGDLSMTEVSSLVIGEPLSPMWQKRVEQWLPTAVYSFLAASLIPYLSPRRLFRSGEEGSSWSEKFTFNVASAAVCYGVPFMFVAYFAHENISLYAQRRIPFFVPGDLREADSAPPLVIRSILTEAARSSTEHPAGPTLFRKLQRLSLEEGLPKVLEVDLSQQAAVSIQAAYRKEPDGSVNDIAEANGFESPQNEIGWGRRFLHLAELLGGNISHADSQSKYEYMTVMSSIREAREQGEKRAHLLNLLLMDSDLFRDFPQPSLERPVGWIGTASEWDSFRQTYASALATAKLAQVWRADENREKYLEATKKSSPWFLFLHNEVVSDDSSQWLFELNLSKHLRADRDAQYRDAQMGVRQEAASVLELKAFNTDGSFPDQDERLTSLWNNLARTESSWKLNAIDRDTNMEIKQLLVTELAMIRKVVDANRKLLESYYPNTLWPSSKVFSYVVLNEDQKVRLNWFVWSFIIFVIAGFLVDLNATSWHGYYAEQIARTWIEPAPGLGSDIPLSQLETTQHGLPYHLISGTMNSVRYDLQNPRKTALFLFSRLFCGSDITGYQPTDRFESGKFMLADAVAVSGGGVSPFREKNPLRKCLMFLANFRTGQWVSNPGFQPTSWPLWERVARSWPITPFRALWTMSFKAVERQRNVFITDGGHIDNLGLEPLLQRRCRLIIAVDATEDPTFQFAELARLTTWMSTVHGLTLSWIPQNSDTLSESARNKLAAGYPQDWLPVIPTIKSEDKTQVTLRADAPRHWLLARIDYGPNGGAKQPSYLLYVKSNVCEADPPELIAYQRSHPPFPHDPTSDLIFEADRFEAYRRLGETTARAVVSETFASSQASSDDPVMHWLQCLEPLAAPAMLLEESSCISKPASSPSLAFLNEELLVLDDKDESWLRRQQAVKRLASTPLAGAAAHSLLERLAKEGAAATESHFLLLELGPQVYPAVMEILNEIRGKPLLRLVALLRELLANFPHMAAAIAIQKLLERSNLTSNDRKVIEDTVQWLATRGYSAAFGSDGTSGARVTS